MDLTKTIDGHRWTVSGEHQDTLSVEVDDGEVCVNLFELLKFISESESKVAGEVSWSEIDDARYHRE